MHIVFSLDTAAGYPLSAASAELRRDRRRREWRHLLTGGGGFMIGSSSRVPIQELIQAFIDFDGHLSSWWTEIIPGILLFVFITMQQAMAGLTTPSRSRAQGAISP